MVKAMDCGIVVSEFKLQSPSYDQFRTNALGKGMNPLFLQLWVKKYHYCSSKRMALVLNNLQRLICNETTKLNLLGIIYEHILQLWGSLTQKNCKNVRNILVFLDKYVFRFLVTKSPCRSV